MRHYHLTIKPHGQRTSTNMTVITNRRSYSFHLREGSFPNRTGLFFEVRFTPLSSEIATAAFEWEVFPIFLCCFAVKPV